MDAVGGSSGAGTEIYAMKKAMEVESAVISKLLENDVSSLASGQVSGAELTGMGQNLDIRA